VIFGLKGFAIGIALQGGAALIVRGFYLRRLFHGFGFLRHTVRAFLPTLPAAAVVLIMRQLEPRPKTVALALSELAAYVLVTALATFYLESRLIREALSALRAPQPAAAVR
jgi:hypothetical protein